MLFLVPFVWLLAAAVTMIPNYLVWNWLGLTNTQIPLWAHNLFGSAFYIFLLRQFFLGLPREVFEAAGWTEPATCSCSARSPCP